MADGGRVLAPLTVALAVPILLIACSGGGGRPAAPTDAVGGDRAVGGAGAPTPSSTAASTLAPPSRAPTTTAGPPTSPAGTTTAPPAGLVDVDPSIAVRLRYATADNFTGAVLPGYHANRALLRPAAAAALAGVDRRLRPLGLRLVVLDAYRPVRASQAMVAWAHRSGRDDLVGPYIASHSEHNRGVAVDVTLADPAGEELDLGTPFDTFTPGAAYAGATGAALETRRRLREAMAAAGFAPYDQEWWHFSFPVPGAGALDDEIVP